MSPEKPTRWERLNALLRAYPSLAAASLFLLTFAVYAKALAQAPPKPVNVDEIIRGVETRYNNLTSLEADFVQRYSQGPSDTRVESGRVAFLRPGKMRWDYTTPERKVFVTDGKSVWLFVPEENQVTRSTTKESLDWRTPWRFLLGRVHLKQLFGRIELSPEEPRFPAKYILRAYPRSPQERFREVLIEVTADYHLTRFEIREDGNIETEFFFLRWRENPPLARSLFEFKPPSGVALIE